MCRLDTLSWPMIVIVYLYMLYIWQYYNKINSIKPPPPQQHLHATTSCSQFYIVYNDCVTHPRQLWHCFHTRLCLKFRGTGFESRPDQWFVIEVVHKQCSELFKGLECAVLSMVLCTITNPWNNSIRVGHSPDYGFLSVAILSWFRKKHTLNPHTRYIEPMLFQCCAIVCDAGPTQNNIGSGDRVCLEATQQTRHVETMMFYCWPNVYDAGPTLKHHCFNVSYLLGMYCWLCKCL